MGAPRDFYDGKKILITGAGGYIGSSLVSRLSQRGASLTLVTRTAESSFAPLLTQGKPMKFIQPSQPDLWESAIQEMDVVFHLAAQTSVRVAAETPLVDAQANLLYPLQVLSAAAKKGVPCVLAGTASVLGAPSSLPATDSLPRQPLSIYDLHKGFTEEYVEYFNRQSGLPAVVLRLANVYGPGKTSGVGDRGVLLQVAKAALRGETINVFGTGEYVRDYVFLDDVVDAFLLAGEHTAALAGKACLISSGQGTAIRDVFTQIAKQAGKLTGKTPAVVIKADVALSELDRRNFVGDSAPFREATGWRAKVDLAEGIRRTLESIAQPGTKR